MLLALACLLLPSSPLGSGWAAKNEATAPERNIRTAASKPSGVSVVQQGSPAVNLGDGLNLPAAYTGATELQSALLDNSAEPLAVAAADYDEDGMPDLVSGYRVAGRGLLTLHRGNVDALYPHSAEAQQRRAEGTFTDAPLLTPATIFAVATAPDFLGAGDFNSDGHWDVVTASRGGSALLFLLGDGRGQLSTVREIAVPGRITALVAGEVNRIDGLTDVVVAVRGEKGALALVFEGPEGALNSAPEIFALPDAAVSLALGQFDDEYEMDLAIVAGHELLVVQGRDRKLSRDAAEQTSVPAARIDRRAFAQTLLSVAAGDFTGDQQTDIALLLEDGTTWVLSRGRAQGPNMTAREKAMTALGEEVLVSPELLAQSRAETEPNRTANRQSQAAKRVAAWESHRVSNGAWPQATRLIGARVSSLPGEDLLVIDAANNQLHLLLDTQRQSASSESASALTDAVSLNAEGGAVAALPMQLNGDALSDLVLLRRGSSGAPTIMLSGQRRDATTAPLLAPSTVGDKPSRGALATGAVRVGSAASSTQRRELAAPATDKERAKAATMSSGATPLLPAACVTSSISVGQTVNGLLSTDDCRFADGSYYDAYTFSGTAGQQVAVSMSSSSFDTYLYLLSPGGSILDSDDDGGGNLNSYIPTEGGFITLPSTGTYTIQANSFSADETGSYTLSLIGGGGSGGCPFTTLSVGQTFNGSLSATDCILVLGGTPTSRHLDTYKFNGSAGQQIAIGMTTPDTNVLDPYLYLLRPDGSLLDEDDDAGVGFNSYIPTEGGFLTLPTTGVYTIFANSLGDDEFGPYTLTIFGVTGSTVVTNTNDSGAGSLRQAIINANTNSGADTITFSIGSGARTINLFSPLPIITSPVTIDGTTQPGYAGTPIIELNGASAGADAFGLKITGGSSRVRGLVINRFSGSGIVITGNGSNIIDGNYIGTNLSGTAALGNSQFAIDINGSSNNTIGGTTTAARNLISGNGFSSSGYSGLRITGAPTGNQVLGNYIGTDITGNVDLGNRGNGIFLFSGTNNFIGGTAAGARNVIAGNNFPGVALFNTGQLGTLVQGNYIGTNAAASAPIANEEDGLIIGGFAIGGDCNGCPHTATNNTIGGTTPAARNVISGNNGHGVEIINLGSSGNNIQGNYIGTNAAGNAAVRNTESGVFVTRAPNNTIGGTAAGAGNVISGNLQHGVGIGIPLFDPVSGQTISGGTGVNVLFNFIGTDATGTFGVGNGLSGVFVDADSVTNTIRGNVIAFNGQNGVTIPANSNPGVRIDIDSNLIYSNGAIGIDLGAPGDTPNDQGDTDGGANEQQNYPVIGSATVGNSPERNSPTATATINGSFNSTANTDFVMVFYFGTACPGAGKQMTGSKPIILGVRTIRTDAGGNATYSQTFTLPGGATTGYINATATSPTRNTSEFSRCLAVPSSPTGPRVQFSAASYSANESANQAVITVTRTDTSSPASVDFATANGTALLSTDYTTAVGRLNFAVGESSKTFTVLITNDAYVEGNETVNLSLTNAIGVEIGTPGTATLTIIDNDTAPSSTNPIDDAQFFVRQHYADFLNRPPDQGGLDYWTSQITQCGTNPTCIHIRRIAVSAAYFIELEFQRTGAFVYRVHKASLGTQPGFRPTFVQFTPDRGLVVEGTDVEASKLNFTTDFVQRGEFTARYPLSQTRDQFIDALLANIQQVSGVNLAGIRPSLVTDYNNGSSQTNSRARVLRAIANDATLTQAEFNRAFVLMQYFGYLQRDPDQGGYDFWLNVVNNQVTNNYLAMVCAFITSAEYQQRFGSAVTRNNSQCAVVQ